MRVFRGKAVLLALAMIFAGCGDDGAPAGPWFPYDDDETVVISPEGTIVRATPDGQDCIEIEGGECILPQDECGENARVDVLVDDEGHVIEIICYPLRDTAVRVEVEDGTVHVEDNQAVLILEDGIMEGDLVIEGNQGIIYGDSPEDTIIDGSLNLKGNETVVRGVTVKGDAIFEGNMSTAVYCVIEGDLILRGNDNLVSHCVVFGSIMGSGNEDRVIWNHVQGSISFDGHPEECSDNLHFTDNDEDLALDDDEADDAEPLSCD